MKSITFIVDEYFHKTSSGSNREEDARRRVEWVRSQNIQPTTLQKYIAERMKAEKEKKERSGEQWRVRPFQPPFWAIFAQNGQ